MEKLFIYLQSRYSHFDLLLMQVFFRICTLTWRVNNYVSRQGKDINRRNESAKTQLLFIFFESTDDKTQYNFVFLH